MKIEPGTNLSAHALMLDMDGALVDSTAVIARLWRSWATHHGIDPDAVLRASADRRAIETVRLFASTDAAPIAEATRFTQDAAAATEGLVAIPGAFDLLRSLPLDRWAVVTSAERNLACRWLRHTGLPISDVLVAAEDVSVGKPDPSGYILAAQWLGFPPSRTIVFEDAPSVLAAAQASGATVIALATTLGSAELASHRWVADFNGISCGADGGGVLRFSA